MNLVTLFGTIKEQPVLKKDSQGQVYTDIELVPIGGDSKNKSEEITVKVEDELAIHFVKEAKKDDLIAINGEIHGKNRCYEILVKRISFIVEE